MNDKRTALLARILLTVLVLSVMAFMGWWAWAGLVWIAILTLVGGLVLLVWLWLPVIRRSSK